LLEKPGKKVDTNIYNARHAKGKREASTVNMFLKLKKTSNQIKVL
jgi:hypothetical protein